MTYRIRAAESDQEAEVMVAPDSHPAIAERIERMLNAGRPMILAVREFTYLGRPPFIHGGLRLETDAFQGGFRSGIHGDDVRLHVVLTNGGSGWSDRQGFGYSERCFKYSGNESEGTAWQRYSCHKAESDDRAERRTNMTHVEFAGGLPGWKWQSTDRIVITEWNSDGVASERVLGFEPGEGSW